jgi:hypothetical protein
MSPTRFSRRAAAGGGPATTLSVKGSVGPAHSLSLAVNSGGGARSPSGTWTDKVLNTRSAPALAVSIAIDGAGNAIAVFGSSYAWDLAGGSWQTPAPLPSGSSGGLAVADPAGTFVYAGTTGNAFTFTAGATSFGTGSGSRTSLGDLKIVPGQAVLLAADAVSAEPVS